LGEVYLMPKSEREIEARLYWCASYEAQELKRKSPKASTREQCEEIEAIAMHSDWSLLRTVCLATIQTLATVGEVMACVS
jgi:hypothetical protein